MAAIAALADLFDGRQSKVVEPVGLLPCSLQCPKVDDFGEIEERSGHSRDGDSSAFAPVVLVQAAAMQPNPLASRPELTASGSRYVGDWPARPREAPERRGAPMAEQRALLAGEYRGEPASTLVHSTMANRERLAVKSVQATGLQPPVRRHRPDPHLQQLPSSHHSVLPSRQPSYCPSPRLTEPPRRLTAPIPPPIWACPSFRFHMDA